MPLVRDPDALATTLAHIAHQAQMFPPSYDLGGRHFPLVGQNGGALGRVLPGRGIMVNVPLKRYGITKPIPGVLEQPYVERVAERMTRKLADQMASLRAHAPEVAAVLIATWAIRHGLDAKQLLALPIMGLGTIQSYDDIIANRRTTNRPDVIWYKTWPTTVSGQWSSMLRATGTPGAMSFTAIPGGNVQSRSSAGSGSIFWDTASASTDRCLLTFGYTSSAAINMALLADILVTAGSIAVDNTAKTVNTTALTRNTTGEGVCITYEVTTALSATNAGTLQTTYTNQAGTGSQVTPNDTLTISGITNRLQPLANAGANPSPCQFLAAGDYGVRSVQTATSASATATTGVLALILYNPLMFVPGIAANAYLERDSTAQIDGLTYLAKDSGNDYGALGLFIHAGSTAGALTAFLRSVQG